MIAQMDESWADLLRDEMSKDYFVELERFVDREYLEKRVFPPREMIFNAFNACPLSELKVVILGQDPYHGEGQANGLSFSVQGGVKIPPSLRNIYKEVYDQCIAPQSGDLVRWAQQGVLLLNTVLTVRSGEPNSHAKSGWELFTGEVIRAVSSLKPNLVFMLWGSPAASREKFIENSDNHLILKSVHPSPLSAHRGFLGCGHFDKANEYLTSQALDPIDWRGEHATNEPQQTLF